MRTHRVSLLVLFVVSLSPVLVAAAASAGPLPAVEPAPQACSAGVAGQAVSPQAGFLDPTQGARQTQQCGTCADQYQACRIGCGCGTPIGGPPYCVDTFTCDPADPCSAVCLCRPL